MKTWYAHMLPLEGKKCYEAYHGRSKPCRICPTIRAFDSGELETDEVPLVQDGLSHGILELSAFPMLNDSGGPVGVIEYVRNITDRKEYEEKISVAARGHGGDMEGTWGHPLKGRSREKTPPPKKNFHFS